jgi:hypothetical protein
MKISRIQKKMFTSRPNEMIVARRPSRIICSSTKLSTPSLCAPKSKRLPYLFRHARTHHSLHLSYPIQNLPALSKPPPKKHGMPCPFRVCVLFPPAFISATAANISRLVELASERSTVVWRWCEFELNRPFPSILGPHCRRHFRGECQRVPRPHMPTADATSMKGDLFHHPPWCKSSSTYICSIV